MAVTPLETSSHDSGKLGVSLANLVEVIVPALDAVRRSASSDRMLTIVEVGAYAGDLTSTLVAWGHINRARVVAIDPDPQPSLVELACREPGIFTLLRDYSPEALLTLGSADCIIVDGDHNYFTVMSELNAAAELASPLSPYPLVMLHDVLWPHGRRDHYADPARIPADYLHPHTPGGKLHPDNTGLAHGEGIPYPCPANKEGGDRNGVLTAVEDFIASRDDLVHALIPAFFGLSILWSLQAPYAHELGALVAPLDRHPLLERLEHNRVLHVTESRRLALQLSSRHERLVQLHHRIATLRGSRTYRVARLLARVRHFRRMPDLWRETTVVRAEAS